MNDEKNDRADRRPFRRNVRFFARTVLYAAAGAVVLILAGLLLLQIDFFRDRVTNFAKGALSRSLDLDLNIGKISGNLLFSAVFDDVRVSDRNGPLIEARRVSTSYFLPLLLKKVFLLDEFRIEGGVLHLEKGIDGRWRKGLPSSREREEKNGGLRDFQLIVRRAALTDTSILILERDSRGGSVRRIENLRLAAGLNLKNGKTVSADLYEMGFDADRPKIALKNLTGRIVYDLAEQALRFERVRIRSEESSVTLEGTASFSGAEPVWRSAVEIEKLSIAEIGRLASIETFKEGVVSGAVSVDGTIRSLSHELALRLGNASLRTRGRIGVAAGRGFDLKIEGSLRNFDSAVTSTFGISGFEGRIDSDFEIQGSRLEDPERAGVFKIELTDSALYGYPLKKGSLRGSFDGAILRLERSELMTGWGSATLQGEATGLLGIEGKKRIRLSADIRELALAEWTRRKEISGALNLALDADVLLPSGWTNPEVFNGSVSARIKPSVALGIRLQEGALNAEWNAGDLHLRSLRLISEDFDLSGAGEVQPYRKNVELEFRLAFQDLSRAAAAASSFDDSVLRIGQLKGKATVSGRISGWWDRPSFEGTIDGDRIRFDEFFAEKIKAAGRFKAAGGFAGDADIKVQNLELGGIRVRRLNAVGKWTEDKLTLDLNATHSGGEKIEAKGEVLGLSRPRREITVGSLKLTAEGDSRIRRFGRQFANQGPIRLSLSEDEVEIQSFKVASDQATLSLQGRLHSEKESSVSLSLNGVDLHRISWVIPDGKKIGGILSADVQISGTGKDPVVKAAVRVEKGSGFDVDFSDLALKINYSGSKVQGVLKLTRRKDQMLIVEGKTDLQLALLPFRLKLLGSGSDISVKTDRLELAAFPIPSSDLEYAGLVDLSARLTGSLDSPAVKGKISVQQGAFRLRGEELPFSQAAFGFEYDSSRARIELIDLGLIRGGKRWFTGNARTGLRFSVWPFAFEPLDSGMEGSVKIDDLDLGIVPFLKKSGFNGGGRLNLSANVEGGFRSPVLDADLTVRGGSFGVNKGTEIEVPFSALNAKLRYKGSKAAIDLSLHRKDEKLLAVTGTSGLELSFRPFRFKPGSGPGSEMDLSLMSRKLRISMLPIPKPRGTDIEGEIDFTARFQGEWDNPRISGQLSLREGRVSMENPALDYRGVSAIVRLVSGKLIIEHLTSEGEEGSRLVCKGVVMLTGFRPSALDIHVTGENFSFPVHAAVKARIRPDLRLTGTPEAPKLTGKLVILQGRIDLDRLSRQRPAEIRVKGRQSDERGRILLADAPAQDSDLIHRLAADLKVDAPKNTWLKGQGLDAEIGGNIQILKEATQPFRLLGSLNTIRGNYTFKGRVFNLVTGTVTFIGLKEPDPNLDIEAKARIRKVDIIIRVGGTLRDIRLSLDSRPQMEQTEIISYLMFGSPPDSLNARNSVSVERAALGLTGQVAASELKRILGEDFFLDTITYESGEGDGSRGSIAVGKYVTSDVFVKYRQGLSADQPSEMEATYEVNKNVSVQTNVGNEKTTGVDVFFEFDF